MEDLDIWVAANALIKRFGEDAVVEAAARADDYLERGDMGMSRAWKRDA